MGCYYMLIKAAVKSAFFIFSFVDGAVAIATVSSFFALLILYFEQVIWYYVINIVN